MKHLSLLNSTFAFLLLAAMGGLLIGCGDSAEPQGPSSASDSPAQPSQPSPAPSAEGNNKPNSGDSTQSQPQAPTAQTSGAPLSIPTSLIIPSLDASAAFSDNGASIDASNASKGWVAASAQNDVRLKFQVIKGEMSYNYDLPGDGTAIVCPVNMGSGSYTFRVMQNTSGSNYVEICSVVADVSLASEFAPYLIPTVFCSYTESSSAVKKARELASGAQNQGDALAAVYDWVCANISYDAAKAEDLSDKSGYVPSPDGTLASGTGICFDYSALCAAMLRSLGIPCQVVTGYVSPNDLYHAWNMVYIDGTWQAVGIDVRANTWSRVDSTFGASPSYKEYVGDGINYTDRYIY